jgi:hypothetical protein
MTDKTTLVFAALKRLAQRAKDSDLVDYLEHSSHHAGTFIEEVDQHLKHLDDLDKFTEAHAAATQPGGSARTYSKAELDRMVAESVQQAVAEANANKEQTFTRAELDAAIAESVKKAVASVSRKGAD